MEITITGTLLKVSAEKQVTETLIKRTFVVREIKSSNTPQLYEFAVFNDECQKIDGFEIDKEIKVTGKLKGKEWKNPQSEIKYLLSLTATEIEYVSNSLIDVDFSDEKNDKTNSLIDVDFGDKKNDKTT